MADRLTREMIETRVGTEAGISAWETITQDRINAFAELTGDHQFIHVDETAARASPFGGTIAHGFLTLSLLSKFAEDAAFVVEDVAMAVNYGFNRVRFLSPVRSGADIRGRFILKQADWKAPNRVVLGYEAIVDIREEATPALIAEWLTLLEFSQPAKSH